MSHGKHPDYDAFDNRIEWTPFAVDHHLFINEVDVGYPAFAAVYIAAAAPARCFVDLIDNPALVERFVPVRPVTYPRFVRHLCCSL